MHFENHKNSNCEKYLRRKKQKTEIKVKKTKNAVTVIKVRKKLLKKQLQLSKTKISQWSGLIRALINEKNDNFHFSVIAK